MNASHQGANSLGFVLFLILGAIGAITPLAIDMYLPAMPSIAKDFAVDAGAVQMSLTAYTMGFALGQLIHGPFSDSYGRKPVMVVGIALFAIGSLVCASTDNVLELTWIRGAQGFAGAAAAVVIQAVVRDMFDREDFARAMSFVTLVITLAPLAAPMIGGHMAVWFGWRSIFWLLFAFALVVIVLVMWKIPETLNDDNRQPLKLKNTLLNYFEMCRSRFALGMMMCGAFSFSGMFAFLTAGSFVYIDIYGVSPDEFGYLFGLNVLALIAMTSINGRFVKKMGSVWMLKFGLTIQFFAGIGLFMSWLLGWGLWGTVPFVVIFIGTISTIGSNSMGLLMSRYPKMAGTASSLAGTLRFGTGSVIGVIVAMMPSDATWPMVLTMALCSLLSMACFVLCGKEKR